MRFMFLDVQDLDAKERHFILPFVIKTFIMLFLAFISSLSQVHTIFPYTKRPYIFRSNFYCLFAPMTTYLKDLAQSIGRYGGHLKKIWV